MQGNIEAYAPDGNQEEEAQSSMEDALQSSGIKMEAPRVGTPAYERLQAAAEDYMRSVLNHGRASIPPQFRPDGENYFRPRPKAQNPSEDARRERHNALCMLLRGKPRDELSTNERNQVSNFAAYLTGHDDYIDQW